MSLVHLQSLLLAEGSDNLYNILIALVCGFASLNILNLLTRQDLPVKDIASRFKISRPAVMKHLRVLRSAKLIAVQPLGRERFQCLNAAPLKQVKTWLSQYEAFWDESLRRLKRQVESES